jgi:hypothetical protein
VTMTLEEFAKDAGVSIIDCGEGWGGRLGYTEIDFPNCSTCGFKTEKAAYKSWLEDKFGKQTAKAILKLLKKAQENE